MNKSTPIVMFFTKLAQMLYTPAGVLLPEGFCHCKIPKRNFQKSLDKWVRICYTIIAVNPTHMLVWLSW